MRPHFGLFTGLSLQILGVLSEANHFRNAIEVDTNTSALLEGGDRNSDGGAIILGGTPSFTPAIYIHPSTIPTLILSENPTINPTSSHSRSPSRKPSRRPSANPTASPTTECHDSKLYRSPINSEFQCEDHKNTPCINWKYIGLSDLQVVELLRSCPVSCNVDCGYTNFPSSSPSNRPSASPIEPEKIYINAQIEYYIHDFSDEKISDDEIEILELLTYVYLKQHLCNEASNRIQYLTEVTKFKIISQDLVVKNRMNLRGLNVGSGDNVIKLTAEVTAVTSNKKRLSTKFKDYIVDAIENPSYGDTLKLFSDVTTSIYLPSPMQRPEVEPKVPEPKVPEPDKAVGDLNQDYPQNLKQSETSNTKKITITAAVIASVSVALAGFLMRKQIPSRCRELKRGDIRSDPSNSPSSYSGDDSNHESNSNVINSHISRGLEMLPSDDSPLDLDLKNHGEHYFNSKESTSNEDNDQAISTHPTPPSLNKKLFFASPESTSTSYIPPMIVIDNIDEEELRSPQQQTTTPANNLDDYKEVEGQAGLFVQRIEASSDLVAALSAKKAPSSKQAYNLLYPLRCDEKSLVSVATSSHSILSSRLSLGDAASALSTPCTLMPLNEHGTHLDRSEENSNIFTFGPETELEPKNDFTVLFEKQMKQGDKSNQKRKLRELFMRKKHKFIGENSSLSEASHYESDAGSSEGSAILRERDRLEESHLGGPHEDSEVEIISNEAEDESCDSSKEYSIEENVQHNYPSQRDTPEKIRHARNESTVSSSFFHKRNISEFSLSTGHLYSFLAPTSGKLGIIIQAKGSSAPTVFQVKDYSPLLGQVCSGDKIVAVDGMDTSNMNTNEITSLLAKKRSSNHDKTRRMKITIMSKYRKEGLQPETERLVPQQNTDKGTDDVRDDLEFSDIPHSTSKDNSEDSCHLLGCHLIGTAGSNDYETDAEYDNDHFL